MSGFHEVSVVNAGKKKKAAKKKAPKKKAAKKKASKKNPTSKAKTAGKSKSNVAKKKKKKSKSNPPKKKKGGRARAAARRVGRRGRGPGGMVVDPMGPFRGGKIIPRMLGKIVSTWCVRKWGDTGVGEYSPTTGSGWTVKNYAIAAISSLIGGELIGRMTKDMYGQEFYEGGMELVTTKMVWTEIIGRFPAAKAALGTGDANYSSTLQQLVNKAREGDIIDDGNGNRWIMRNGRANAMLGLEEKTNLGEDGYEDIDSEMGQLEEKGPMGHLMSASATHDEQETGRWGGRGSVNPYQAAYM